MLDTIWFNFLYQPLFNALIWIYVHVAGENLGWAVIWLTIFLRILLLPLSIISYLTSSRRENAAAEARSAMRAYKNDPVAQKVIARKIMRKYHLSPWATVLNLAIQLLVLVLLYQVFLQGINGEKVIKTLYQNVIDFPGQINTSFYGFNIGRVHDSFWAGLATLYLIISTFVAERNKSWSKNDMYFIIFFPIFTFFALWYLPMVKSLFILTTMIFSDIIKLVHFLAFSEKPKKEEHGHGTKADAAKAKAPAHH